MQAQSIDEVIKFLDEIVDWSRENKSRLGYFAALYRKVTIQVKEGIQAGRFENGVRMEKLDVVFANRYLAAFTAHQANKPTTSSWQVAFATANRWRPIVLQHLLIGMNAHINLDLGIAAAQVAPGPRYADLQNDFNEINIILAGLVNQVKDELSQVWPILRLLNFIAGSAEDAIINFSMEKARNEAWYFGRNLAPLNPAEQAQLIHTHDSEIALLGRFVARPPLVSSNLLLTIRLGELGTVPKIIDILAG